ncbi:MAG: hypothetical protein KAY32_12515 [Candidatus Eisenbacteria sp.]|nr:hypothetical protein [Candidatus Eisenbacteria bacterium]
MDRTKRAVRVLMLGLAMVVLGLLGYLLPHGGAETPTRVYYDNTGGGVLFPHEKHAEMEMECAYCHHEMLAEEIELTCTVCHHAEAFAMVAWEDEDQGDLHAGFAEEGDGADCLACHEHDAIDGPVAAPQATSCAECHEADHPMIQAGHSCSACHAGGESDVLMACRSCHGAGEGSSPTCASCHEEDGYTADLFAHGELVAIAGHHCAGCHVPTRSGTVMHGRCNRCHLDLEEGTFFTRSREDAPTVCTTCHLKQ